MSRLVRSLDHSNGHAFLSNGVIYYSPNCFRKVQVPPPTDPGRYKFREWLNAERLKTPVWWHKAYGWLSFMLLEPQSSFVGVPLARLAANQRLPIDRVDSTRYGYMLNWTIMESWERLKDALVFATTYITRNMDVRPGLRMPPPTMFGYKLRYPSASGARDRALMARDAFVPLMSFLSFLVACLGTAWPELSPQGEVTRWALLLKEQGFSQVWLNGILGSDICKFHPHVSRAGIFLDWLVEDNTRPSVEWFCEFNIPVWYRWTSRHAEQSKHNPQFFYLKPPEYILQNVATFLVRQPSQPPQLPAPSLAPTTPLVPTPCATLPVSASAQPTWKTFLEERKKRFLLREKSESPQDRQRRLQRERDRGVKRAQIFEWNKSDKDPTVWVRAKVSKRFNEDVWSSYGSNQRIYNAWDNEWDLCDEFGPDDSDSDDDHDHDHELSEPMETLSAQISEDEVQRFMASRQYQLSPEPEDRDNAYDAPALGILEILSYFYGFVPPLSTQASQEPVVNLITWDECAKTIGYVAGETEPPSESIVGIIAFVARMRDLKVPEADLWDISADNRISLVHVPYIRYIRRVAPQFYLLDVPDSSSPWILAFTSATITLFAARLLNLYSGSVYTVAEMLIRYGVNFHTVVSHSQFRPPPSDSLLIPFRLSGYTFSFSDYAAYVSQREAILCSPRGRAAILAGGIIWRLAIEHLSADTVLCGPSSYASTLCDLVNSETSIYDDRLTDREIEAICGLHLCFTGSGTQTALKSWWPLPSQWNGNGNGMRWGRWSLWNEHWFQKRLQAIRNGDVDGQPLTAGKWHSKLKGLKYVRTFTTQTESASFDFLCQHVLPVSQHF